jgi:hypothetical protein
MLNDPLVLEASRVLAEKLIANYKDEKSAIDEAFVRILGRLPKSEEEKLLKAFYVEELSRFQEDPDIAVNTLMVGDSPAAKMEEIRTAALMQVIVAIYNLEETLTKT